MIRKKTDILPYAAFLFVIALALNPNLFQEGLPIDERVTQNLPDRLFNIRSLREGSLPLWNPFHFWGTPHIATHQSAFFYPPNLILFLLLPPIAALKASTLLHGFFAGLFMFLYLKRLRIAPCAAITGAIAFMTCGYMLSHECHTANRDSVVWIPLIFFFIEGFLRKPGRVDFLGGAFSLAIMIFSGYMHTVVIAIFYVIAYLLFRLLLSRQKRAFQATLGVLAILLFGALLASVQISTTWGVLDQTVRDKITYETFSSGHFPLSYLPLLFFPYLFGARYSRSVPTSYCGVHNLQELTGWMEGVFLVLGGLGFLSMKRGRRRHVAWAWAFIGFISLILCLGPDAPLNQIMFRVPVYNLFKGPAKNWLGAHLAVSVLASLGIHYLIVLMKKRPRLFGKIASFATLSLFALVTLMTGFIMTLRALDVQRWEHTRTSSLQTFLRWENPAIWVPIIAAFFLALVFSIFLFARRTHVLFLCIPIIMAHSLFLKHNMYIRPVILENIFTYPEHNAVFCFLKNRENDLTAFRIYPARLSVGDGFEELLYPCVNSVYGIRSLAGYGPLYSRDFSELSRIHSTGISFWLEHLIKQNLILSMFNVKYITIYPTKKEHETLIELLENAVSPNSGAALYREAFRSPLGVRVYENLMVNPLAFAASRVIIPPELRENPENVEKYCDWLYEGDPRFDPRVEALFMTPLPDYFPDSFAPASVNVKDFQPNRVKARINAKGTAFIVFSEAFFPGWKAFLDGKPVKTFRVNIVMRGVLVPPGEHSLVFRYRPPSFVFGAVLSCLSLAFLLGIFRYWNRLFKTGSKHVFIKGDKQNPHVHDPLP